MTKIFAVALNLHDHNTYDGVWHNQRERFTRFKHNMPYHVDAYAHQSDKINTSDYRLNNEYVKEYFKKRDNETGMIAPLNKGDIIHNVVNIDVFEKSFTNDFSQFVKYNVARTIELIKKGDFPF